MSLINKIWSSKFWLPITIVVLVAINWLASLYHTRIDFTNEKRFTLSSPTKKILKQLDDAVQIDVFLKGEFPSGFKKLANSTSEILQEFKEVAGKKLQYNFISADEIVEGTSTTWGDTLSAAGLYPINLKSQLKAGEQQQLVYPVALVRYKESVIPVNLYTGNKTFITPTELNSAEALMEFKFADAIYKATQTTKPVIAYAIGHGEPQDIRTYDLAENFLNLNYSYKPLDLTKAPRIPDVVEALLLVKPTQKFSDLDKLKIDQFVMRGGKVIMFIDKLNAEMDSLRIINQVVAYDRDLELNDLLFKYGVRINSDLVMDLQCDYLGMMVNGSDQTEDIKWNYFPLLESKSNHIINKNLGLVSSWFSNSIDTVEVEGIKKTVLLSSSSNSRTISTPALISPNENSITPESDKYKKANIPTAVLLEGKFTSLFNNRLSQQMADSLTDYDAKFLPACVDNNKVIVVADGDIVLNSMAKNQPLPMGVNPFVSEQHQYQFANKQFLENCLDYLINPSGLSQAKAKDYTLRLLDSKKVEAEKTTWQLITIALPILLVILFAFIFQWLHKRKFTINYNG